MLLTVSVHDVLYFQDSLELYWAGGDGDTRATFIQSEYAALSTVVPTDVTIAAIEVANNRETDSPVDATLTVVEATLKAETVPIYSTFCVIEILHKHYGSWKVYEIRDM